MSPSIPYMYVYMYTVLILYYCRSSYIYIIIVSVLVDAMGPMCLFSDGKDLQQIMATKEVSHVTNGHVTNVHVIHV